MRDDFFPVRPAWVGNRGTDQAKVLRLIIGEDVEVIPEVIDVVFVLRLPRQHHPKLAGGVVGVQDPELGGEGLRRCQAQVLIGLRLPDPDVELGVHLFENQLVGGRVGTQRMTKDPIRPEGLGVLLYVEESPVVVGPGHIPGDVGDQLRKDLTGAEVLEVDGVKPPSLGVHSIGQDLPVFGDLTAAHGEVLMAFRQDVGVQHDLFWGVRRLCLPGIDGILHALLVASVVEVAPVPVGDRGVVRLDPVLDLLEEGGLKLLRMGHGRSRVFVLGLQVGDDLRVFSFPQPEVVVRPVQSGQPLRLKMVIRLR